MRLWLALIAVGLQIALSPILSVRAVAMAIDPLAMPEICSAVGGDDDSGQSGGHMHCDECCMVACADQVAAALRPSDIGFLPSFDDAAPHGPAVVPALPRGPPTLPFSATGPPSSFA